MIVLQHLDRSFLAKKIVNHYFSIALGVYLITMLHMSFRPGVAMSIVLGLIAILVVHRQTRFCLADFLVLLYVLYNLLSYFWISLPGFSFAAFCQEVITSIFPIFLYYGMDYANRERLYFDIVFSVLLCVIIGIVLYITLPQFYLDYACFEGFAATNRAIHVRQGLSSYIGRIPLGTYVVVAAAVCLKDYIKRGRKASLYLMMLFVLASALTAQRSSWFGCALLLMVLLRSMAKTIRLKFLCVFFATIIIAMFANLGGFNNFSFFDNEVMGNSQIATKSINVLDAVDERFLTWSNLINNTNIVVGRGLGTGGHRARSVSRSDTVTDGNYMKMLGEIGVIGLVLFFLATISALVKLKENKENDVALFIVFFILLQNFGSNITALQITAPLYWMGLGFFKISDDCMGMSSCVTIEKFHNQIIGSNEK